MIRTFEEWGKSLPIEYKEKISSNKKPLLNMIDYIWLSNLMSGDMRLNPTIDELLNWIISEQIDAKRK